jgi:hypothetical protein
LSFFPRSERETLFLVDFVARPPHVFLLLVDFAARPQHVAARPQHVVAPVLPARLLLVDFATLPEAIALDAQNLSPFVIIFRGYKFVIELKVWIRSLSSIGHYCLSNGPGAGRLFLGRISTSTISGIFQVYVSIPFLILCSCLARKLRDYRSRRIVCYANSGYP